MFQAQCKGHSQLLTEERAPQHCSSSTLRPPGSYLGGVVGDALEDPVHGRRVQREVGWQLHFLDHQLVLHGVPMNLQETKETQTRQKVT